MKQIHMSETAVLDARPEDVYATIADYHNGHPRILPKENLYDLQVEQGGFGAGTIIRFKSKMFGVERAFYQRVSEPEPGRVIVEQDIDSPQNFVTTFTITPVEQGQKSRVEIATTLNVSPGLAGVIEQMIMPRAIVPMYRRELKLLEAVAQERPVRV